MNPEKKHQHRAGIFFVMKDPERIHLEVDHCHCCPETMVLAAQTAKAIVSDDIAKLISKRPTQGMDN